MGWMDKVTTLLKGGRIEWSKGTSKTWSAEKTWSPKKADDAKSATPGEPQQK